MIWKYSKIVVLLKINKLLRNKYFIPDSIIILLLLISLILNKIARNLLIWTDERKKRKQTKKT